MALDTTRPSCPAKAGHPVNTGLSQYIAWCLVDHPLSRMMTRKGRASLHLLAEIGRDDLRVGAHLRRGSPREGAAVDQHREGIRGRENRRHFWPDPPHSQTAVLRR